MSLDHSLYVFKKKLLVTPVGNELFVCRLNSFQKPSSLSSSAHHFLKSGFIISGDKHLKQIRDYMGIKILAPSTFLNHTK